MPEPSSDIPQSPVVAKTLPVQPTPEVMIRPDMQRKQLAWDAKRQEVDQIVDRLGMGVDEGIKETVIAFQMNGINTTNSCEGHADRMEATPLIGIGALNRPVDRFNGETEIFHQIAKEHNMSVMEMRRSETPEARQAYFEANTQTYAAGETDEFAHWREATEQLGRNTEGLLDEFYRSRSAIPEVKLSMGQLDDGMWTLVSGTEESLGDKTFLQQRQEEMRVFTDFLRTRYFGQNELSESQRAFEDAVSSFRTHLQLEVFLPESTLQKVPTKDALTLEQVRQMFFVPELKALRHSTLWQREKHISASQQDVERQRAEGEISVNASVDRELVDVIAEAPDSQTNLLFTHAWFTARESLLIPGRRVYELLLQGDSPGGIQAPAHMTGRYTQGQFVDRVSLTYPDGSRVRKIFWHNPLKETIDAVTPP